MNKKFLALLTAALVLLCTVACTNNTNTPEETLPPFSGETESGTEAQGTTAETTAETTIPDEIDPTFADVSLKVVVLPERATIRNAPDKSTGSEVAWPAEGTELTVTGESEQWYRLSYGGEVRYIRKSLVAPASALEGFTAINDTVVVNTNANIRSYPLVDSYTVRLSVKAGTELERVAVGAEWSRVKVTVTVEGESGQETQVVKEYYISNSCIDAETVTSAETGTETVTETQAAA